MTSAAQAREVGSRSKLTWKRARQLLGIHVRPADDDLRCLLLHRSDPPGRLDVRGTPATCSPARSRTRGRPTSPTTTRPSSRTRSSGRPCGSRSSTRSWPRSCWSGLASAWPCSCRRGGRWVGLLRTSFLIPGALGLATASLLYWGLYSGAIGPFNSVMDWLNSVGMQLGIVTPDQPAQLPRLAQHRAPVDDRPDRLEVLGLLHDHPAGGAAGDPARRLRGGRHRWREPLADLPQHHPAARCAPRSRSPLILCITGSLLAFDQFYILTKGGPDNTTVTVVQLIYREAFIRQNLGTAAALSSSSWWPCSCSTSCSSAGCSGSAAD